MQVEIEISEKQAQRRLSGQEGFEMCLIGGVGSEGMGSSRNYRQRLQEEHEGQAWGLCSSPGSWKELVEALVAGRGWG